MNSKRSSYWNLRRNSWNEFLKEYKNQNFYNSRKKLLEGLQKTNLGRLTVGNSEATLGGKLKGTSNKRIFVVVDFFNANLD